jgi:site-specific DNA-methyltransferase (adenine-specific)
MHELHHGNCLDILRTMPDASVDAVVTDPPYGLSFMGKRWDYDVPSVEIWEQCLRVLKPGGYLLAFAGTRTQHRMAVRIEDAGFEIRDMIAWMYGSGFPKSHNVSKGFDREAGILKPEFKGFTVAGSSHNPNISKTIPTKGYVPPAPVTDEAKQWQGWGTALKPAMEPITMARKPFKGTVADNVQAYGTGAINIDGCRIMYASDTDKSKMVNAKWHVNGSSAGINGNGFVTSNNVGDVLDGAEFTHDLGRWPANVLHDGCDDVLRGMGEAARFFYTPKACKEDRDDGCEMMEEKTHKGIYGNGIQDARPHMGQDYVYEGKARNFHPTVKPTDLMRYLCRMVTPPGGIVLDPFTGSGSTGRGAVLEGFQFIGCEMDADYIEIAKARILAAEKAYQPCLTFD